MVPIIIAPVDKRSIADVELCEWLSDIVKKGALVWWEAKVKYINRVE